MKLGSLHVYHACGLYTTFDSLKKHELQDCTHVWVIGVEGEGNGSLTTLLEKFPEFKVVHREPDLKNVRYYGVEGHILQCAILTWEQ